MLSRSDSAPFDLSGIWGREITLVPLASFPGPFIISLLAVLQRMWVVWEPKRCPSPFSVDYRVLQSILFPIQGKAWLNFFLNNSQNQICEFSGEMILPPGWVMENTTFGWAGSQFLILPHRSVVPPWAKVDSVSLVISVTVPLYHW